MKHQRHQRRRTEAGFSLIELLIVVVIIGILSAVAVPKLLENIKLGRQTATLNSLRTIHQNEAQYSAMKGKFGTLKELSDANLIESTYAGSTPISGYTYNSTEATADQYCVQATRAAASTAYRDYNVIEDVTIRFVESKSPAAIPRGEGMPTSSDGSTGAAPANAPKQ